MSRNIFVYDTEYIEYIKKGIPAYTKEVSPVLYTKLERDKKGKLIEDTSRIDEVPVTFILTVSTSSKNKIVVDDLTNLPFFKATPQKYCAYTLWENCCIVAKEFVDTYKNPAMPDYKFYPNTDFNYLGAFIHYETNKVYMFCHLLIKEGLEEALSCTFIEEEEYRKLYGSVADQFKREIGVVFDE